MLSFVLFFLISRFYKYGSSPNSGLDFQIEDLRIFVTKLKACKDETVENKDRHTPCCLVPVRTVQGLCMCSLGADYLCQQVG
jgi:hypothetical protein